MDSLSRLNNFVNDLDEIVAENYELRREVKRLREVEKEYREFLAKYVNDANRNIGMTLKALLNETQTFNEV